MEGRRWRTGWPRSWPRPPAPARAPPPAARRRGVGEGVGVVGFVLMVGVIGVYVAKRPVPLLREEIIQDTQGSVRYVSEHGGPDDVVYVHAGMVEQFRLYSRLTPMRSRRVILGRVGGGGCPRVPGLGGGQGGGKMPGEGARGRRPSTHKR